jgi:hypothetical protein
MNGCSLQGFHFLLTIFYSGVGEKIDIESILMGVKKGFALPTILLGGQKIIQLKSLPINKCSGRLLLAAKTNCLLLQHFRSLFWFDSGFLWEHFNRGRKSIHFYTCQAQ